MADKRPALTTSHVDNANTNYRPSVARNDLDQSLQPTGAGGIAGNAGDTPTDKNGQVNVSGTGSPTTGQSQKAAVDAGRVENLGDWDKDGKAGGQKMLRVRLRKNYQPEGFWQHINAETGEPMKAHAIIDPKKGGDMSTRVLAGQAIYLPFGEAKGIIAKGIAESEARDEDLEKLAVNA